MTLEEVRQHRRALDPVAAVGHSPLLAVLAVRDLDDRAAVRSHLDPDQIRGRFEVGEITAPSASTRGGFGNTFKRFRDNPAQGPLTERCDGGLEAPVSCWMIRPVVLRAAVCLALALSVLGLLPAASHAGMAHAASADRVEEVDAQRASRGDASTVAPAEDCASHEDPSDGGEASDKAQCCVGLSVSAVLSDASAGRGDAPRKLRHPAVHDILAAAEAVGFLRPPSL